MDIEKRLDKIERRLDIIDLIINDKPQENVEKTICVNHLLSEHARKILEKHQVRGLITIGFLSSLIKYTEFHDDSADFYDLATEYRKWKKEKPNSIITPWDLEVKEKPGDAFFINHNMASVFFNMLADFDEEKVAKSIVSIAEKDPEFIIANVNVKSEKEVSEWLKENTLKLLKEAYNKSGEHDITPYKCFQNGRLLLEIFNRNEGTEWSTEARIIYFIDMSKHQEQF